MSSAAQADVSKVSRPAWLLLGIAIACFFAYAFDATWHSRALYADGAFFYADILSQFAPFDDSKHIRLLVNVLNQSPLLLLLNLGVVDPFWLRLAFNAPLFFGNALCLLLLWGLAKRHDFYAVAFWGSVSFIATVLPSDIFAINQARLAQGLYWIVLFFALTPRPIVLAEKLLLLAVCLVGFRSHESIIFMGPIISLAAWSAWRRDDTNRAVRLALMVVGLVWCFFGLYWQMSHPVASGTAGFFSSIFYWRVSDILFSTLFFGWSLVLLLMWQCRAYILQRPQAMLSKKIAWLYLPFCLLIGLTPWWWPLHMFPPGEFAFRFFIPFGGAALACIAITDWHWSVSKYLERSVLVICIASSLIGMSLWQVLSTRHWVTFQQDVKTAIAQSPHSLLTVDEALAHQPQSHRDVWQRYYWGWTFPALSLAVSDQVEIAAMIMPTENDEFFYADVQQGQLHIPFNPVTDRYFNVSKVLMACRESPATMPVDFCR